MDQRVIRDMNSSILQAAEIQNRIKKVHQLEVSPLIDTYNSLNEPHAHPMGLLSGMNQQVLQSGLGFANAASASYQQYQPTADKLLGHSGSGLPQDMVNRIASSQQYLDNASLVRSEAQFVGLPGSGIRESTKNTGVASALKLDRVYPINLSYRQGGHSKASTQRDSSPALRAGATERQISYQASLEFQKASGGVGLNKKLAINRLPNAHASAQQSASTLPPDFRKIQSMTAGAGSPFDPSISPDLPLRLRPDQADHSGGDGSNQAEYSGAERSRPTIVGPSPSHPPGQGVRESANQFNRDSHRNQVLLSKSPNIFTQNQQSNQHLGGATMSQPNVKLVNHSLNRLLDNNNKMAGPGPSSGSNIFAAPDLKATMNQNAAEPAKSGVFGLGGRKTLNEQSGAGVGMASGAGLLHA